MDTAQLLTGKSTNQAETTNESKSKKKNSRNQVEE
jgi:hypothetical protein